MCKAACLLNKHANQLPFTRRFLTLLPKQCSIATGYPLESLLFSGRRSSGDGLRFPSMDFDAGSAISSQSSASFASTAADSPPQPGPQPHLPEASKWKAWLHSSGNGRASKFLHRIWFQLQVQILFPFHTLDSCLPVRSFEYGNPRKMQTCQTKRSSCKGLTQTSSC